MGGRHWPAARWRCVGLRPPACAAAGAGSPRTMCRTASPTPRDFCWPPAAWRRYQALPGVRGRRCRPAGGSAAGAQVVRLSGRHGALSQSAEVPNDQRLYRVASWQRLTVRPRRHPVKDCAVARRVSIDGHIAILRVRGGAVGSRFFKTGGYRRFFCNQTGHGADRAGADCCLLPGFYRSGPDL